MKHNEENKSNCNQRCVIQALGVVGDDRYGSAQGASKPYCEAQDQVKLIVEGCSDRRDTSAHRLRLFRTLFSPQTLFEMNHLMLFFKLTDLAVAEMYCTTISRLVLRSFPRRGALRSSFKFMSSYKHKNRMNKKKVRISDIRRTLINSRNIKSLILKQNKTFQYNCIQNLTF